MSNLMSANERRVYENQVWHLAVSGTGRVVCVETSVTRARTCANRAEKRTGQQHFVRQVSARTPPAVGSNVILRDNPTRTQNIVIGAGLGVLGGGLLLGFPGALVGFGVGAYAGAAARPTRRALLENQRRCPVGTQVQTLIFDRDQFSRSEAIAWARRNAYRTDKVDTTANSFRIRQSSPGRFTRDSFRTISLSDRVKAVIGCPRR
jgi:hypothetical protein